MDDISSVPQFLDWLSLLRQRYLLIKMRSIPWCGHWSPGGGTHWIVILQVGGGGVRPTVGDVQYFIFACKYAFTLIFFVVYRTACILLCMTQEKKPHHSVRSPRQGQSNGEGPCSRTGAHTVNLVTFRFTHVIKQDYHHMILIGKLKFIFYHRK
jgi:hypothetical protein